MSKRGLLKYAEETSSSSSAEDEISTIAVKPMRATALAKPTHTDPPNLEKE